MMDETPDYYALLGIGTGANGAEIKTAFKRMALKYHPDVYSGPDAEERMRMLLTAYKTLTNPSKRKTYDLAHGISRRAVWDDEEPLAFYRAANGRGFTTSSGSIPTPGKAHTPNETPAPKPAPEMPSRVTASQVAVTFPRLDVGASAVIALEGFAYTLTPPQAARLREDGRLLGSDMPQRLPVTGASPGGRRCSCHRCGHSWIVPPDQRRSSTDRCPQCSAPDWAEYLLLRCQECTAVFESQQIRRYDRVKIGARYYGDYHLSQPYDLFPHCPHCQTARWCAGEEMRLNRRAPSGARAAGPLSRTSGPRPSVSGGFPRASSGHIPRVGASGAFPAFRSGGGYSDAYSPLPSRNKGVPKKLFTLVIALLIAGSLFALYAILAVH